MLLNQDRYFIASATLARKIIRSQKLVTFPSAKSFIHNL